MTEPPLPAARAIGTHTVARVGYGAMQLGEASTGGRRRGAAPRRRTRRQPHRHRVLLRGGDVNAHIRRALAPYREDLVIVSKVGALHNPDGPVPLKAAQQPAELRAQVEDDLRQLGIDSIPVVNLRRLDLGPGLAAEGDQIVDLDDQLAEMIALRDEGKIGAIGVSNVPLDVLRRALPAGIVCVQNAYSVLDRGHEEMLDFCVAEGIAWVPFFPLGSAFAGFPKRRRQPGGRRDRGRTRRDAGPGRARLAAGPRPEHLPDSRHAVDRAPRGEHRRRRTSSWTPDALARLDAVSPPQASPRHQHGFASFLDR